MYNSMSQQVTNSMVTVYQYFLMSLTVTFLTAYLIGSNPELVSTIQSGPIFWMVILLPIFMILGFSVVLSLDTDIPRSLGIVFLLAFSGCFGVSLSLVFAITDPYLITLAFVSTITLFVVMTIYGLTTNQDLSSWGAFLMIGLISVIIVSVINLFLNSDTLGFVVSGASVIVFLGLISYDNQNIREQIAANPNSNSVEVIGAISLYLDFINLFLNLLRVFTSLKD